MSGRITGLGPWGSLLSVDEDPTQPCAGPAEGLLTCTETTGKPQTFLPEEQVPSCSVSVPSGSGTHPGALSPWNDGLCPLLEGQEEAQGIF